MPIGRTTDSRYWAASVASGSSWLVYPFFGTQAVQTAELVEKMNTGEKRSDVFPLRRGPATSANFNLAGELPVSGFFSSNPHQAICPGIPLEVVGREFHPLRCRGQLPNEHRAELPLFASEICGDQLFFAGRSRRDPFVAGARNAELGEPHDGSPRVSSPGRLRVSFHPLKLSIGTGIWQSQCPSHRLGLR